MMSQRVDSRAARVVLEEERGPGLFLVRILQPCENWHSQTSGVLCVCWGVEEDVL